MTNKIKGLTKREIMALAEFEKLLRKKFPKRLRKLVLFGSKARGDSNSRSSDLDVLVVVTKNGKRVRQEVAGLTHEPIVHFAVDLSPIIIEERELKTWSPFLQHVKKEGIVLWTKTKKSS